MGSTAEEARRVGLLGRSLGDVETLCRVSAMDKFDEKILIFYSSIIHVEHYFQRIDLYIRIDIL